jgi:hypothetical protein
MKFRLTPTRLRIMLMISLVVTIALSSVINSFAFGLLEDFAVDVSHTTVDATASQNNLQNLQQVQQKLAGEKDVIQRASSIVADSQSYQYQDQILTDLKAFASQAGIVITNLDFSAATTSKTPTAPAAGPAPVGVKSTSVSVTLKNPVNYVNFLKFVKSIEQNLTKMQISKVALSKAATGNDVSSETLIIEVYIR